MNSAIVDGVGMEDGILAHQEGPQEQEIKVPRLLSLSHPTSCCPEQSKIDCEVFSEQEEECTIYPYPVSELGDSIQAVNSSTNQETIVLCDEVTVSCDPIEIVCIDQQQKQDSEATHICNKEGGSDEDTRIMQKEMLEAEKKQILTELEDGALLDNKICSTADVGDKNFRRREGFAGVRSAGSKLKIEVIDDTALVIPMVSTRLVNDGRQVIAKETCRKKSTKSEEAKAEPHPQRRTVNTQKTLNCVTVNELLPSSEAMNLGAYEPNHKYSRTEMECLRYVNLAEQQNAWKTIYNNLEASVSKAFDNMAASKRQKQKVQSNFDSKQRHTSGKNAPGILGEVSTENFEEIVNTFDEEEDSDEEYSIQRRAFLVEGEPDFDSGPPEDGLEYLRRVKWEAAQIPKIQVAKLDRSKMSPLQTIYMPQIPEIPPCPPHLLPWKQWEESFLEDFSNLRKILHQDESFSSTGEETIEDEDFRYPTLSRIMAMDCVARVSQLNKRICMVEFTDFVSFEDCVWLFALCAAVDIPLHASTCAAIRNLLRKCATLRAKKSQVDDELVMLNIIITIAGRFFGQAET